MATFDESLSVPPPPEGFSIDNLPPPPEGFVIDSPVSESPADQLSQSPRPNPLLSAIRSARESDAGRFLLGPTDIERDAGVAPGGIQRGVLELPGRAISTASRATKAVAIDAAREMSGVRDSGKNLGAFFGSASDTPTEAVLPTERELSQERGPKAAVEKGLIGLVGMLPELAVGKGLGGGSTAFATSFGASTWEQTRDAKATAMSVALGYLFPFADKIGGQFGSRVAGKLSSAGIVTDETALKTIEAAGRQSAVQALAHLVNTPQYITDPKHALDTFIETTIQTGAFAIPEVLRIANPEAQSQVAQIWAEEARRFAAQRDKSVEGFHDALTDASKYSAGTPRPEFDTEISNLTSKIISERQMAERNQNENQAINVGAENQVEAPSPLPVIQGQPAQAQAAAQAPVGTPQSQSQGGVAKELLELMPIGTVIEFTEPGTQNRRAIGTVSGDKLNPSTGQRELAVTTKSGRIEYVSGADNITTPASKPPIRVTLPIQQFASDIGWTVRGLNRGAAVAMPSPEQLAAMTEQERGMYAEIAKQQGNQWDVTDTRENSPTKGLTFYVPENATPAEMKAIFDAKMAQEAASQKTKEKPGAVSEPVVTPLDAETAAKEIANTQPIVGEQINAQPPVNLPAEKPKLLSIREAAQKFNQIIFDNAAQLRWAEGQNLDDLMLIDPGAEHLGTAGIEGSIARKKAIKIAQDNVAKVLGLDPRQIGSESYRAEHLPKLQALVAKHRAFNEAIREEGDSSGKIDVETNDLKVGDTLTLAGSPAKVESVNKRFVVIDGGEKFGRQEVPVDSTISVDGHEPVQEPAKAIPKLGAMEKGTGDLLKGQTEDFALVGERGTDVERAAASKDKAEADKAEAKRIEDDQQQKLFEQKPKPEGPAESKPNELPKETQKEESTVLKEPFSDGSKVQIRGIDEKDNRIWMIQPHTILRETTDPKFPDERTFEVQNDKTGEKFEMDQASLRPITERTAEQKAKSKKMGKAELDAALKKASMDPSAFPDAKSKKNALERAEAKLAEIQKKIRGGKTFTGILGVEQIVADGAITIARGVLRTTNSIMQAVQAAIDYIRQQGANFNEDEARGYFGRELSGETTEPTPQPELIPGTQPVRSNAKTRRAQVMGLKMGETYEVQQMSPVIQAVRDTQFDSRPAVDPERTTRAFYLVRALSDDRTKSIASRELYDQLGGDNAASSQILQNELMDYATKLAISGDQSLARFIIERWGKLGQGQSAAGLSEMGRVMRAVQESKSYRIFSLLGEQLRESRESARAKTGLDESIWNQLVTGLDRLNVDPESLTAERLPDGKTLGELLEQAEFGFGSGGSGQSADLLNRIADAINMDRGVMGKLAELANEAAKKNSGVRLENVNESEASRILESINKMFPESTNWRDLFTNKGTKQLADTFFKLISSPSSQREPNVSTFEKVVSSELSRLLKQSLENAGYKQTTTSKQSTAEKIAMFLGNDPLRSDKLAKIDEEVRKGIESQPEEMQNELTILWDTAMGTMREASSSNTMARRIVSESLKELKPDWNTVLGNETATADLRRRVLEDIESRIIEAQSPRAEGEAGLDLRQFNNLAGLIFDGIVRTRLDRRTAARRMSSRMADENITEKQATEELDRYERDQTEWLKPDGPKNLVRELIQKAIKTGSGDEAEFRRTLAEEFRKLGVSEPVSNRLAEEVWGRKQALDAAKKSKQTSKQAQDIEQQAKSLANKYELTVFPGKRDPNIVVKTIQEYLKPEDESQVPPVSQRLMVDELSKRLEGIGVTPDTAAKLAYDVYERRERNWQANRLRQQEATSQRGSIWSLVNEIQQTPYLAQKSPGWRLKMAEDWFMRNGLSRDQAEAAAKTFNSAFEKKMVEAGEQVARKILEGKTDPENIPDIIKGIRSGLLDPSRSWTDVLAQRAGWKPVSEEQFKKLAELELKSTDPALSPQEYAATQEEMMAVMRHVGPSDRKGMYWRRLSESFVSSLLSGLRTGTVQLAPVVQAIRDSAIELRHGPSGVINYLTALYNAGKEAFVSELKYAWQKDAYGYHLEELDRSHKELKGWWEKLEQEYKTAKNPAVKAWVRARQLWAAQQYVSRLLSTIDQSMMATIREPKLVSYASNALKEAGLGTQKISDLVEAIAAARKYEYEQALSEGIDEPTARVRANARVDRAVWEFVNNMTGDSSIANQVLKSAENDIYSMVGRKAHGVKEAEEGMLSNWTGMNDLMQFISKVRGQEGPSSIAAVALTGFVNVPFRTMRYMSSYTPYGFLRYGLHKYAVNQGKESHWKQSFGTELQARQRLYEAIAGTVALGIASAWGAFHHTSDDDANDPNKKFGLYITGSGPSRKDLRDAWTKEGWRPYSMNFVIDGVKVRIPVTRVGESLLFPMILPATLDDVAWKKKERAATGRPPAEPISQLAGTLVGEAMYMTGQKGLMQGVVQLAQASQGNQGLPKAAAKLVGGTVAATAIPFKQLIQSFSDMIVGPLDQSSASALVAAQFPIVGIPWQKKAINRFGDEIGDRTWFGIIERTGIPVAFKLPDTAQNRSLYPLLVEKGVSPPELRRSLLEEKYGSLTNEQFADFAQKSGSLLKQSLVNNLGTLKNDSPDEVKSFLAKAAAQADKTAAAALALTPVEKPKSQAAESQAPTVTTTVAASGPQRQGAISVTRPASRSAFRSSLGGNRKAGLASFRAARLRRSGRIRSRYRSAFRRQRVGGRIRRRIYS